MTGGYKICSWDVGIKNLAYCVIEKTDKGVKVLDWDKINLVEDTVFTCSEPLKKTGKICGKTATFSGTIDGTIYHYCGTHKKNFEPFEEGWEEDRFEKINSVESCGYVLPKKGCECGKKVTYYDKSSSQYLCTVHKKTVVNKIVKERSLKRIKKKKCTNTDMQIIAENLYKVLDNIPLLTGVDKVFIENQPSLTNPTMKTVSSLLFGYFVARGIIDKYPKDETIATIKFISPSNKIKVEEEKIVKLLDKIDKDNKIYGIVKDLIFKHLILNKNEDMSHKSSDDREYLTKNYIGDDVKVNNLVYYVITYLINKNVIHSIGKDEVIKDIIIDGDDVVNLVKKIAKDDKNYEVTKLLAIEYTKLVLEGDGCLSVLDKYKKKDDLCDAFLQGLYALKN